MGPHGFYALPGRMLISALSNAKDGGGQTALVEYNHDGEFIRTIWMPDDASYGYDARIKPELNRMLTSSFTGKNNYMRKLPELMGDAEAMKNFGRHHGGVGLPRPEAAPDAEGPGRAARDPLGARAGASLRLHRHRPHLEADRRLSQARRQLRGGGDRRHRRCRARRRCRSTSASRPTTSTCSSTPSWTARCASSTSRSRARRSQVYEHKIGPQVNMVSQSWDGKRLYFTTSLLANWDGIKRRRRAVPEGLRLGRKAALAALRDRLPRSRSSAGRTS